MKPLKSVKAGYLPPVPTMRKYCLTRCESGPKAVRLCQEKECPLHPYRMGKQPNRSGIGGKSTLCQKKPTLVGVKNKVGVEAGQTILSRHRLSGEEIVPSHIDLKSGDQFTFRNGALSITVKADS